MITKAEKQKRVNEVYTGIIQSQNVNNTLQSIAEKYNVSIRQSYYYYKEALKQIADNNKDDIETMRFLINTQLNDLYRLNYEEKKYNDCLQVLKLKSKINGLEIFNINNTGSINLVFSRDEREVL
jgi:ACT domain-containing protein